MEPTHDQQVKLDTLVPRSAEVEMREDGIMVIALEGGQVALAPDGNPTELPCADCGCAEDVHTSYDRDAEAWLCAGCREQRAADAEADAAYDLAGDR